MTKDEYVKTLVVNGIKVDIGIDDYGQCYFFEYIDKNGKLVEESCGTYNLECEEYIRYRLDPEFKKALDKQIFGE